MEFPIWKRLASYFWEFKLEEVESEFSNKLQVSLHQGNVKLSTENAIYSFGNQYTSFKDAFNYIDIHSQDVRTALILGLGLGSVVQLLDNHKYINKIVGVDIDNKIIYLCNKYLKTNYSIEYIASDAFVWLQENHITYDLVISDLFIDDKTPTQFTSDEFLFMLKNSVSKNGILLFSKLEITNSQKLDNDNFAQQFINIFKHSFSLNTSGNRIFIFKQ